jgi:flavin-binding protein dodecin
MMAAVADGIRRKEARMLQMVEVVGTSPTSHYEAVKAAVDGLLAAGRKVHFFTVTEHRGAVRAGKIEFQAVVKVAVEG